MPKFRITDRETGRSVVVSGDSPPTEAEAEAIFQTAGLRQTQANPVGDALGNVANFLLPQTSKTVRGMVEGSIKPGLEDILGIARPTQFNQQTAGAQREVGAYVVPAAGAVAGGVAGGLTAASQEGAGPLDVAKGAGVGAGAGLLFKGAGQAVGKAVENVGGKIAEQGEQLVLRGLKPTKTQLDRFKERTGKDLATWLNKQGITGDFVQEAQGRIDVLQEQFDDLAVRSGATVTSGKLQQLFIKRMEAMKSSVVPSVQGKAQDLKQVLDNIIGKHGDAIDVSKLTDERRAVDQLLKEAQFTMPVEQANYLRSARDAIQEAIQDATKGKGPKDLKTLGLELRDLFEFQRIAEKQGNLGRGTNLLGLTNTIAAGGGGVIGGVPGAIAGAVLPTILRNPTVVSTASKVVKATGKGIERAGKSTALDGRFEAMKRALRNTAASQMSRPVLPGPRQ